MPFYLWRMISPAAWPFKGELNLEYCRFLSMTIHLGWACVQCIRYQLFRAATFLECWGMIEWTGVLTCFPQRFLICFNVFWRLDSGFARCLGDMTLTRFVTSKIHICFETLLTLWRDRKMKTLNGLCEIRSYQNERHFQAITELESIILLYKHYFRGNMAQSIECIVHYRYVSGGSFHLFQVLFRTMNIESSFNMFHYRNLWKNVAIGKLSGLNWSK